MKHKPVLLLHPLFLCSVLLLLLNDLYLKYAFPSFLTGKLSDITGLLAFTIFFFHFFPTRKISIAVLVAGWFIFWKSPLSDPLIFFLQKQLSLPVSRVKDPSDLFCILIIPFAFLVQPVHWPTTLWRTLLSYISGILAFIAFSATTLPRKLMDDSKVRIDKYITTRLHEQQIINKLEAAGYGPIRETVIYDRTWQDYYYIKLKDSDMVRVDSLPGTLYRKIAYGHAYVIPVMPMGKDTIYNVEFIITESNNNQRSQVELHDFTYPKLKSSALSTSGYDAWRKWREPIRKKIKAALK